MTWLSRKKQTTASLADESETPFFTRAGGITLASPAGNVGTTHFVVEAAPAPLGSGVLDLTSTDEQFLHMDNCEGSYILERIYVWLADKPVDPLTLNIRTGSGVSGLALPSLDLSVLSERMDYVRTPEIDLGRVLRVPALYLTLSQSQAQGTARVQAFGKICALNDPNAYTYDPSGYA